MAGLSRSDGADRDYLSSLAGTRVMLFVSGRRTIPDRFVGVLQESWGYYDVEGHWVDDVSYETNREVCDSDVVVPYAGE